MSVAERFNKIQDRISKACQRSGRNDKDITLIAVTKYSTIEKAKEVLEAGIVNLGENRDQEFLSKFEAIGNHPVWHFIGTLQTRKVKNIIDKVDYIHSLDRLSLAEEINKRSTKPVNCFVQVNVSAEPSKHGLKKEDVIPFIEQLQQFKNINVVGLMTMAPNTDDETLLRNCFRELKNLQLQVQEKNYAYAPCSELSMGMSNDYEIAIEEGATMIRIGTALVGENE